MFDIYTNFDQLNINRMELIVYLFMLLCPVRSRQKRHSAICHGPDTHARQLRVHLFNLALSKSKSVFWGLPRHCLVYSLSYPCFAHSLKCPCSILQQTFLLNSSHHIFFQPTKSTYFISHSYLSVLFTHASVNAFLQH